MKRIPVLLVGWAALLFSCKTSKPVSYLQGNLDTLSFRTVKIPEPIIQKGDLLDITIYSDNPEVTAIYNQASGQSQVTTLQSGTTGTSGYLVDQDGNIRLHAIGILHVEGLTKKQLSDLIVEKLIALKSLSNPYCVVKFENFKITVIGEVKSQGVFTIPGEKASILEGIGMAGGIADYGKKDNVLLIREEDGNRSYAVLDLSRADLFSSPYFYLKQNDILIVDVDPRKMTAKDQETQRRLTILLAAISTVAILINVFK